MMTIGVEIAPVIEYIHGARDETKHAASRQTADNQLAIEEIGAEEQWRENEYVLGPMPNAKKLDRGAHVTSSVRALAR